MYPPQAPWTGIGSLQQEVSSLKQELNRKADTHEISSLNSKLVSLECTIRELRTEVDGLRFELQRLQESKLD